MDRFGVLRDKLIVLIEDHDEFRNSLSGFLVQQGAKVIASSNAVDGLRLIEQYSPAVVVTDIGLPERDGFQLLQDIRALGPLKGGTVPVIAMTAFARVFDKTRCIAAGFQRYLAKAFSPDQLLELISSILKLDPGND